jgi:uncharacterized protein YggE
MSRRSTIGLWVSSLLLLGGLACDPNESQRSAQSAGAVQGTQKNAEASPMMAVTRSNDSNSINVYGKGSASAPPDIVLLTLGVEAREEGVQEARQLASTAMTKLFVVLSDAGIEDRDIQTRAFSITPEYTWREKRDEDGNRTTEQIPAGYTVSNQVLVHLRDIAKTGYVIDSIASAGGDLTRVRGVRFTIDDPTAMETKAREMAVLEGMKKARHLAETAGVKLGLLLAINESGTSAPSPKGLGQERSMLMMAESTTPVAGGELEVQVTLQMRFSIVSQ